MIKFSLVICTYMRPESLKRLLDSVVKQTLYPSEIIIVDGSTDNLTKELIEKSSYKKLQYHKVDELNRGLTKQRNFGIAMVEKDTDIISFLDDDTVLTENYFYEIVKTYEGDSEIIGVGGVAINESNWTKQEEGKKYNLKKYYLFDSYVLKEGKRNVLRNCLGLQSNLDPGRMPSFSNGRSSNFPLSGKTYYVDLLIGMSFSFHRKVFEHLKFSTYFEGYGLYEDADYSLRALNYGKNVVNTKAALYHYHDLKGRPNKFKYGKMVVRNGWYVWRVKYKSPSLKSRLKWNLIAWVQTIVRFINVFNTSKRKESFTEALGRTYGWLTIVFNKPKVSR